ncbi:MAG: thiol:disulfide interchange protein [Burkholderiaceae bacterium]|nr:MAG: thiol:disulfide interchange protein [Burkholderiaceae bacterium]TAM09688.1 MAG: thiol:disulfide interchange protein [Pusillimonas sp.]
MDSLLLLQVVLAVGAGLLLNLTPCVLPAVPLKVRAVLREAGERPSVRLASAALFTAGSVLFFAALGLATALLQWCWGVLFQSQSLLIALSALLAALAIVNFSGRSLPLPSAIATLCGRRFLEPFLSGLMSALLSTPCTGPLLGGVLVFALTQPLANIISIFVAIGVGLAAPYVVLILRPSLLRRLPRAGAWSKIIQQSFGWLLLAAALFYAQSVLPAAWRTPLWVALFVAVLTWVAVTLWHAAEHSTRTAALLVGATAITFAYLGSGLGQSADTTIVWQPLRAADVATLPTLGRPALVEFTAQWCINCKVLEKTVYEDHNVVTALRRTGTLALQVDLTRPDPTLEHLLASYGGVGLPLAVVLDHKGQKTQALSGLFTSASLVRALNKVGLRENSR